MKNLSKYISLLLVLIMLFSTFSIIPASAAETVKYTCTSVSGEKGSNVTVTVKLSSSIQLFGANVSLKYNSSELQYVSCSKGSVVSGGSLTHVASTSSVNFSGMYGGTNGTVFTVTFKILKVSGTSSLTLSSTENTDNDGNTHTPTVSSGTVTVVKPVTSISLNKTSATMKKGETLQLSATVSPSDATDKTVTYKSSNTSVATVSSSGKVTAKGGGIATITATAGGKSATCKITVNVAQTGIADATGNTNKTVYEGGTLKLSVNKVPADATDNYSVTWTSSDNSIVTVSNGTITGVSVGTATVTATSNGWKVTYKITVVEKPDEPTSEPESEEPTEEPTTEEPTTEESTTEIETTTVESTTEESTTQISGNEDMVTKNYHYLMLVVMGGCLAVLSALVTFIVTSAYYRRKIRNEYESDDEE